jgi:hypothetical protein
MARVDFGAARQQAEDAGLISSSSFYKYKEGDNRLRLMSECLPHTSMFDGKKNFKWLCYVLDRVDGEIKPFFMPHKIYKAIEALQLNPDYAFDEVPMPYDLTVNAKGAGTMDVEYSLIPARKETPLTSAESEEWHKQKPVKELQAAIREKQEKDKAGKQSPPEHVSVPDYNDADAPPF